MFPAVTTYVSQIRFRLMFTPLALIAVAALVSCNNSEKEPMPSARSVNPASNTAAMIDADTREALLIALDDERRAEAFYMAVINKFGRIRPFANIVGAEQRHQTLLLPLLKKYNMDVPTNPHDPATFDVPATWAEACAMGVKSEIDNVAMYDRLLPTVKEQDIRDAFHILRSASQDRHLPAFRRCAGN